MNLYHIVFRILKQDTYSKGFNIKADNEIQALKTWLEKYPLAEFISLIKLDV